VRGGAGSRVRVGFAHPYGTSLQEFILLSSLPLSHHNEHE